MQSLLYTYTMDFPGGSVVRNLPAKAGDAEDMGSILGQEEPLEKGMATYSITLAWTTPWTRGIWWATVHWITKHQTQLSD